jgi:hypothetical protein
MEVPGDLCRFHLQDERKHGSVAERPPVLLLCYVVTVLTGGPGTMQYGRHPRPVNGYHDSQGGAEPLLPPSDPSPSRQVGPPVNVGADVVPPSQLAGDADRTAAVARVGNPNRPRKSQRVYHEPKYRREL